MKGLNAVSMHVNYIVRRCDFESCFDLTLFCKEYIHRALQCVIIQIFIKPFSQPFDTATLPMNFYNIHVCISVRDID